MTFRLYHDPHFKPPRSAAKYAADQRRDESSARENAAFVAEFLSNYRPGSAGSADPAATFKALRLEARRLSKGNGKAKAKGKLKVAGGKSNAKGKALTQRPSRRAPLKSKTDQKNVGPNHLKTPHPWLKRKSSLRYLSMPDGNLLSEYFSIEEKIEQWRQERELSVDARRKAALAEQIQIQYEKRHDVLALIYDRALSLDDGASP